MMFLTTLMKLCVSIGLVDVLLVRRPPKALRSPAAWLSTNVNLLHTDRTSVNWKLSFYIVPERRIIVCIIRIFYTLFRGRAPDPRVASTIKAMRFWVFFRFWKLWKCSCWNMFIKTCNWLETNTHVTQVVWGRYRQTNVTCLSVGQVIPRVLLEPLQPTWSTIQQNWTSYDVLLNGFTLFQTILQTVAGKCYESELVMRHKH